MSLPRAVFETHSEKFNMSDDVFLKLGADCLYAISSVHTKICQLWK